MKGHAIELAPYLENPDLISDLGRADLVALLADVKALEGRILGQLLDTPPTQEAAGDKLLTVEEAAQVLAVSRDWLYQRGKRLGLAVKLGDGTLRFSHAALQEFMRASKVNTTPARRKRAA